MADTGNFDIRFLQIVTMKALVIGATGSTGKLLVDKLLEDMAYRTVVIFVSKTLGKEHPKLIEHIVNLSHLDAYREYIVGDVVFLAFGKRSIGRD